MPYNCFSMPQFIYLDGPRSNRSSAVEPSISKFSLKCRAMSSEDCVCARN